MGKRWLILFAIILPTLIFALPQVGDEGYFWTQDQGFFKFYRQVRARVAVVDSPVVVWTEEYEYPIEFLFADQSQGLLYSKFTTDKVYYFTASIDGTFGKDTMYQAVNRTITDAHLQLVHGRTVSRLIIGTDDGIYMTVNPGQFTMQDPSYLSGYILQVASSPANLTNSLVFYNQMYAISSTGEVYTRTLAATNHWTQLTSLNIETEGFEGQPDTLTLPSNWTRLNDDGSKVHLTNAYANSGTYALAILASNETGDWGARYTPGTTLNRYMVVVHFLVDSISGVPEFVSGRMVVNSGDGEVKLEVRSDGVYYGDTWVGSVELGTWNVITFIIDKPANTLSILSGKSKIDIEFETTTEQAGIYFLAPSNAGYSFYVDDVYLKPMLFDLAPHTSNRRQIYLSASDGVYLYNNSTSTWDKVLDRTGYNKYLRTAPKGTYYALLDPETHKVIYSSDEGNTWTDITGSLPDTIEFNDIALDDSGYVYLATSDYLYKYDGTWHHLTNGFTTYSFEDLVKDVKFVAPLNTDTIYVVNKNGIYASFDAGSNWVEWNNGELGGDYTSGFADSTVFLASIMVSDSGLIKLVNDYLGSLPDVDKDGALNLLVMNILDEDENGNTRWFMGYFDYRNEMVMDTASNPYSNHMELFYIDNYNLVNNTSGMVKTLTELLTEMVAWWLDPDEESWQNNMFSNFIYNTYLYGSGSNPDTLKLNWSILGEPINSNTNTNFAFIMYLRDLYGMDFPKKLANAKGYKIVDPMTGRRDSIVLQGVEALDTILVREGSNFTSVLKDFFTREFKMSLAPDTTASLPFIEITSKLGRPDGMGLVNPLSYYSAKLWNFNRDRIVNNDFGDTLMFNGADNNDFKLDVYYYHQDGTYEEVSVDPLPEGNLYPVDLVKVKNDTTISVVYVLITETSTRGTDPSYGYFLIETDLAKDTTVDVGIVQSPLAPIYAKFYLYSNRILYKDVGVETPSLIMDQDTIALNLTGTRNSFRYYTADIVLPTDIGETGKPLYVYAEDGAGNTYCETLIVKTFYSTSTNRVFALGNAEIIATENGRITTISTRKGVFVKFTMDKVSLRLPINGVNKPVVAKFTPDGWEPVGGVKQGEYMSVTITEPGYYRVIKGEDDPAVEDIKYAVSFMGTNMLKTGAIVKLSIPEDTRVRVNIIDATGRMVKTLHNGELNRGIHFMTWNGDTETGTKAPSGVYFVIVTSDMGKLSEKTVLVR